MKVPSYAVTSAAKVVAGTCLGVLAVGAALIINPALLLPLVALGGASVTVAVLDRENTELRAKLAEERERAAKVRRACAQAIEGLPEGGVANFLAAALVAGRPQAHSPQPQNDP